MQDYIRHLMQECDDVNIYSKILYQTPSLYHLRTRGRFIGTGFSTVGWQALGGSFDIITKPFFENALSFVGNEIKTREDLIGSLLEGDSYETSGFIFPNRDSLMTITRHLGFAEKPELNGVSCAFISGQSSGNETEYYFWVGYINDRLTWYCMDKQHNLIPNSTDSQEIYQHFYAALSLILLKKYAPINVKYVSGRGKGTNRAKVQGEKYINDTDFSIQILDSTWFTTLIRAKGFNVNGHFRLQPCGKGRKEKKLIWINPYQKKGYIRKAKKIN